MFIQLKDHKAHVFIENKLDSSKENFIFIPGAGMDHRTLSMFKLDSIEDNTEIVSNSETEFKYADYLLRITKIQLILKNRT